MPAYPSPKPLLLLSVLCAAFFYSTDTGAVIACTSVQGYGKALELSKAAHGCQKNCPEAVKETAKIGGCSADEKHSVAEKITENNAKAAKSLDDSTQKGTTRISETTFKSGADSTKDSLNASKGWGKDANNKKFDFAEQAHRRAFKKNQALFSSAGSLKTSRFSDGRKDDFADLPRSAPERKVGNRTSSATATYSGNGTYVEPRKGSAVTADGSSGAGVRGGRAGETGVSDSSTGSGGSNAGSGYNGSPNGGMSGGSGLSIPGLPASPEELAKAAADLRLVEKAQQRIRQNKPFPREEALKAHDPQIRKDLLVVSAAQETQTELKKEEVRLEQQLIELIEIKTLSKERAENFGTLPEALAGRVENKAAEQTISQGKLGEKNPAAESNIAEEADNAAQAENVSALKSDVAPSATDQAAETSEPKAGSLPAPDGAEPRHARREGLRDKIDAYLKQRQGAEAKILDTAFDGKLAREAGDKQNEEDTAHGLGDVIGTAFNTVRDATFSMRMSETEAEVNALLSASQRELASLAAGGVLSPESPNLFERVSFAHRRCEEHRCVRGGSQP